MPEIKRTFNVGKMNRDLDDRIVPPGEYREALNINIGQSEGSDVGAVENLLGNELVAANGLSGNSKCIGSLGDEANEKIYYFITTNSIYNETNTGSHGIYEYDQKTRFWKALIVSQQLNFHVNYPISGINLIDDLLFWTDNRNYPRKINVVTASNDVNYYTASTYIDNLISVCKFAPYESATLVTATRQGSISSTFLEDKLVRFSYRWKFEDNEYSTLAPFSSICFSRLDQTDSVSGNIQNFGEIETFTNAINQIQLQIPTPTGYGIKNVELIYKESGSGTLYVAEDKEVTTEPFINFTYSSTDPFRTLPGDQLTRVYDSVPRKALSQEVGGGRLVYGNFLQNYNVPSIAFNVTVTGDNDARNTGSTGPLKNQSVKSRRTYQVGVVLADKFGRQSPVILSSDGVDTVYVDPSFGAANSITAFNALRIAFTDVTQIPEWAYSYKIVVKQREQEYYNWISLVTSASTVERLGDSINKIPRDQTAVIPPSTGNTISPCDVSVYPKYLGGGNVYTSTAANNFAGSLQSIQSIANPQGTALVNTLNNAGAGVISGVCVFETEPVSSELDIFYETSTGGLVSALENVIININFFNCILLTFDPDGAGANDDHIEINRIRAGYNQPFFDVGVRAYVVQENFTEERRNNTLIHSSGLLNSRTGINYINQFNEAEGGLTISLDPLNGSIQKLFSDDTQIIVFQESKVSRSPIDKDFIYSAEGGAVPVTSSSQFLGTIAAYAGQFGISKDPGSFASYGFSRYFTDKSKGTVLRLSQNGIQEISQAGMGDFFRDALKNSTEIIGSYDEYSRVYELTIIGEGYDSNIDTNVATASDGYLTLCFDDRSNGWTSYRSFKQEDGVSLNNTYYTFSGGDMYQHHSNNVSRNNFYGTGTKESYIIPIFNDAPSLVKQFNSLSYEGTSGWELDYIQTDISSAGAVPVLATSYNTTLQLSGSAPQSIFNGANTVISKENVGISWAIFVSPLNSQYAFDTTTFASEVILTQASGSSLTITNPTAVTDGNLVFLVQHTVGNLNTVQTLNITGTGPGLAFTVALLTVNTADTVSSATINPASQVFNNVGSNFLVFTIDAVDNYYIDDTNITISTVDMPASTAPGTITNVRSGVGLDNLTYTIPITVPSTATAGTILVNGAATIKYLLQLNQGAISAPLNGTVTYVLPIQANGNVTGVGVAFYNSPYDVASTRTVVITYTCSSTQVLFDDSYIVTGFPTGTTPTPVLNNNDGTLVITKVIPVLTADTMVTPIVDSTVGPATATLGTTSATQPLTSAGTAVTIASTWNVSGTVSSPGVLPTWLLLNGANTSIQLIPGTSFTIGAETNPNPGTPRTTTIDISLAASNTRVTGAGVTTQTITITQA